ncbi:MAG: ribonuclease H-like domain-containing protein [Armatimonadetes bacterium]|nr:ribonuclease H-like domain-containing protein [Armatimonadota bacterium]MDW8121346.1 ribonuclease H-like domain-containing protein [Armatimonadota bacterium]
MTPTIFAVTFLLRRTFLHFTQIGERRERHLWRMGFLQWEDLLRGPLLSEYRSAWSLWVTEAELSADALEKGDASFFAARLPRQSWWRAVPEFAHKTLFLDIETTGLFSSDAITLVGIYDGKEYLSFVRRDDWEELRERLGSAAILVTYNGTNFDLPILRDAFPDWSFPPLHIDLCPLLRRLGYRGGLKGVERQLGLVRSDETASLTGLDAVRLWWRWVDYGDSKALDLLIRYNREDVVHLEPLLVKAYTILWEQTYREGENR